ncbi:putative dehydrogenase [Catalinimonas alkaloidigena]|uniref:Gfo/Idh/MocA family protein n=1 Tax=Catalinimonas alkaloidigena TaxID=1075417 RepID=UPI0024073F68|nr:Gfo/Idh/MocA family oxidoreductase [Catalinimonas alkaloidigena]MDF9797618.1 putative dehydrogenase [Catalinimonas alkaloidigena]
MRRIVIISSLLLCIISMPLTAQDKTSVKIGVAGLVHDHVHWILRQAKEGEVNIVGIAEPNRALARRYADQYGFSMDIVYPDIESMLEATEPEAVTAFNEISNHLAVVQACAPKNIDVMVEKPLATNMGDAREIAKLAHQYDIEVITNYETTWYPSNHRVYAEVHDKNSIGELRKVVVRDGHKGPKEIGVSGEFLSWLTDPEKNGGGALVDFGCYGANLITWLMKGQRPESISAVVQQIKPEIYPRVDDEATIIVTYPQSQGIIQASWNWPFSRKDMSVYGKTGYIYALNAEDMKIRKDGEPEEEFKVEDSAFPFQDPFEYLSAVVRKEVIVKPSDLSSLENNLIVVEILDAAKLSASSGSTIYLR